MGKKTKKLTKGKKLAKTKSLSFVPKGFSQ